MECDRETSRDGGKRDEGKLVKRDGGEGRGGEGWE